MCALIFSCSIFQNSYCADVHCESSSMQHFSIIIGHGILSSPGTIEHSVEILDFMVESKIWYQCHHRLVA